ncbi:hypothetical protein E7X23_25320 [Bacteroides fragilis]|nr:hypothetical protein E7X23_25320 [Bacteroides fragilis]
MKYPTMRFVFDRKKVATKTHKGLVQIEVLSEGRWRTYKIGCIFTGNLPVFPDFTDIFTYNDTAFDTIFKL